MSNATPQRCYVVEFVGAKAAGKTTLARRVAQRLAERDPVGWSLDRHPGARRGQARALLASLPAQLRAGRAVAGIWPPGTGQDRAGWLRRWRRTLYLYRRFDQRPGGYLLHEGVLQLLQIVHVRTGQYDVERSWTTLTARGPRPDAVVHLQVPEAVIAERRFQRARGRETKRSMTPEQRTALDAVVTWLAQPADARPRLITVVDPGDRDLDDLAAEVIAAIADGPYRRA